MQEVLNLDHKHKNHPDDFIVSSSNFEAYKAILNYTKWQNGQLLIMGPRKSGRTFLAKIWQYNTGAVFVNDVRDVKNNKMIIVDNIEKLSENSLINIINFSTEESVLLLLISNKSSMFSLKDLNSRIKAIYTITIKEPDEKLFKLLIIKLFKEKQLKVSITIINFIYANVERRYNFIYKFIEFIDKLSKITKRKVTLLFVQEVFSKYYKIDAV